MNEEKEIKEEVKIEESQIKEEQQSKHLMEERQDEQKAITEEVYEDVQEPEEKQDENAEDKEEPQAVDVEEKEEISQEAEEVKEEKKEEVVEESKDEEKKIEEEITKEKEEEPPKEIVEEGKEEEQKEEAEEKVEVEEKVKEEEQKVEEEVEEEKVEEETEIEEEKTEEEIKVEGASWYIIHTYSGHEYRVKERIEQRAESMNMKHKIAKVMVPEEETVEIKNNKRIEKTSNMFPGYVFVEMILDEETWFLIRKTTGVAKFLGPKSKPIPVTEKEMLRVLQQTGVKSKKIEVDFEVGELIKVIGGPFRGYSGGINEIFPDRGKLKAKISIFGRETPVELDFNQVEKVIK